MPGTILSALKSPLAIAIGIIGLIVLGVGAGIFVQKQRDAADLQERLDRRLAEEAVRHAPPPDRGPPKVREEKPAGDDPLARRYLPLGSEFLSNFGRSRHFMIVEFSIATRYGPEGEKTLIDNNIPLRSEVMAILADLKYDEVKGGNAKELVAARLKDGLNRYLLKAEKIALIDEVLIARFVVQ
jgi:flagellar basal body-associated protein FliL